MLVMVVLPWGNYLGIIPIVLLSQKVT